MNRIDRLVLHRLATRIGATVFVFYGLIALVESLDTWRFNFVAEERGVPMALLMVAMSAVRWTIKTLPVTVLLGAILGIADLKARQELTVIKASGFSIWRVLRAPTIVLIILSFVIALGAETISTQINRELAPTPPGKMSQVTPPGEVWLEQSGGGNAYVILAHNMSAGGSRLGDVTVFLMSGEGAPQVRAETAELIDGYWVFPEAILSQPNQPATRIENYRLPTRSTAAEISLKLASTEDQTFFELATMLNQGVTDSAIRSAAAMRMIKLLALPLVLTGSLFIAFAFTAGYSRHSQMGRSVLYGMVLGFIVFVITEMADRAGTTGVLDPVFAATGPALIAIIAGVSVLLYKEDGWT
jgi:lipopolysaccharide export system permease protein